MSSSPPCSKKEDLFGRGERERRCGEGSTGWLLGIGTERVPVSLLFFQDGRRRGASLLSLSPSTHTDEQLSPERRKRPAIPKERRRRATGSHSLLPPPRVYGSGGKRASARSNSKGGGREAKGTPRFLHSQGGRREGLGRGSLLAIHFFFWDFYAREKDSGEEEEEEKEEEERRKNSKILMGVIRTEEEEEAFFPFLACFPSDKEEGEKSWGGKEDGISRCMEGGEGVSCII